MRPPIGGVRLEDETYDWLEEIERKLSRRAVARRYGMNKAISEILGLVQKRYPIVITDLLGETLPGQDTAPTKNPGNSHKTYEEVWIKDPTEEQMVERRQAAKG